MLSYLMADHTMCEALPKSAYHGRIGQKTQQRTPVKETTTTSEILCTRPIELAHYGTRHFRQENCRAAIIEKNNYVFYGSQKRRVPVYTVVVALPRAFYGRWLAAPPLHPPRRTPPPPCNCRIKIFPKTDSKMHETHGKYTLNPSLSYRMSPGSDMGLPPEYLHAPSTTMVAATKASGQRMAGSIIFFSISQQWRRQQQRRRLRQR